MQDQLWNVTHIQATGSAFAAIRSNGAVVTWGNAHFGGDSSHIQEKLKSVRQVPSTLHPKGSHPTPCNVLTYKPQTIKIRSPQPSNLTPYMRQVQCANYAFAAILEDGSVEAWGADELGGDCSSVTGPVLRNL